MTPPHTHPIRHGLGLILRVLACSALLVVAARAADTAKRSYKIPADEAAAAFRQFSEVSGKEILFAAEVVRGVRTNAVQGEYTPMEALGVMLQGTGIQAVQDDTSGAISVRRSPPPDPVKEQPKQANWSAPSSPAKSAADETVVLSAFEVSDNKVRGYQATSTSSATRLNTPIVELSKSIQIITRDMLDDLKVSEINAALYYTSAVSYTSQYSGRVAVRGFENAAVKRNGLGNYGSDESISDTATIERIEVVKGPSSLLYGSSSPGGVVNYETKKPLSYHQDSIRFSAGSWDHYRVELDSGGPLIGDGKLLNYRFVGAWDKSANFGANDHSKRGVLAGTARWHISPDTYVLAGIEYDRGDRTSIRPMGTYPISATTFHPDGTRTYNDVGFILTKEARGWTSVFAGPRDRHNSEVWRYDMDFSHKVNEDLNVFLHYNYIDNNLIGEAYGINGNDGYDNGLPTTAPNYPQPGELVLPVFFRNPKRQSHNGTATVNYNIKRDSFETQIIAGWEFYRFDLKQGDYMLKSQYWPVVNFRTGAGYSALNFANTIEGVMQGVTNGTWNISDQYVRSQTYNAPYLLLHTYLMDRRLRLVGGIRRDDITINQTYRAGAGTPTDPYAMAAPTYTNSKASATTPMLGASFTPFEKQRGFAVYANYSESLVANEIVNPDGSTLPPEKGKGFETGLKFDLTGKFSATVSWFTIDKTNLARGIPNTLPQRWEASGLQRSRGVDMDFFYAVTPDWQVMANAAFIDAYYVEDRPALVGTQIAGVPKRAYSLWNKYTFPSGFLKGFSIGGGAIIRSETTTNGAEYPMLKAPGFTRFDLLFGYTTKISGHETEFSVKVNNVFDKVYLDGTRGFGDPLSVQSSVTFKF